jgi:photosystem II stability/assembly factor-like uncharacterized protein
LVLVALRLTRAIAFAHIPHDDIYDVVASPDYHDDRAVFVIVRNNLLASRDGGRSWERLLNGLDYLHELSSLDMRRDGASAVLLMSSYGDGIYVSHDVGQSWSKATNGLADLRIHLVSMLSPSTSFAAGADKGLYRTTDGGRRWTKVLRVNATITAIASRAQETAGIVVVGDHRGRLYRSTSGGESWEALASLRRCGPITAIALSPGFPGDPTVLIGTRRGGLFKSTDGGRSCWRIATSIPDNCVTSLTISPGYATDGTVLVSTWNAGVFGSTDRGDTWGHCNSGLTTDPQADYLRRPHFSALRMSPRFGSDRTVFVGGFDGLFRSANGGRAWEEMATLSAGIIIGVAASAANGDVPTVAVSTYLGGAYISTSGGDSWAPISDGLQDPSHPHRYLRLFDMRMSPNFCVDRTLLVSTHHSVFVSNDSGAKWSEIRVYHHVKGHSRGDTQWMRLYKAARRTNGHGKIRVSLYPSFASDGTVYLGTQEGDVLLSRDGARNFSLLSNVGNRVLDLAISPAISTDRTLFATTWGNGSIARRLNGQYVFQCELYRSTDGGRTWRSVGPQIPGTSVPHGFLRMAMSPAFGRDGTLFIGSGHGLFKSVDRAQTWRLLDGRAYGGDGYIEGIAVSPSYERDGTVFLSVRGRGLFRSCDGGHTFVPIATELTSSNSLPSHLDGFHPVGSPIICSPSYETDRTVYGISGVDLLVSRDGGESWSPRSVASGILTPRSINATAPGIGDTGRTDPLTSRVSDLLSSLGWTRRKVLKLLVTLALSAACYASLASFAGCGEGLDARGAMVAFSLGVGALSYRVLTSVVVD